jgi:hypothetical protein
MSSESYRSSPRPCTQDPAVVRVHGRRVPRTENITLHSSSGKKYCHTSASCKRSFGLCHTCLLLSVSSVASGCSLSIPISSSSAEVSSARVSTDNPHFVGLVTEVSPTFFSIPLTSHQQIAPVEATNKELRSIQNDWDTRAPHTMCENAVLQIEPAIRDKLR